MTDGAGGYEPGKLIVNSARDVGSGEVQHVLALIDATGFWKMPAENEAGGLDGAQWIFEGYRHGS